MRHRVFGNQLGRNTKQARALYRSLVGELLDHGRIETTLAKAKAVQGLVDKVINLAKKNSVSAQREITKILGQRLNFQPLAGNRNSGFTRIIRLGQRLSDTTEKVILELVDQLAPAAPVEPVQEKTIPVKSKPKTV